MKVPDDPEIEAFLKQFRPRRPAPLPLSPTGPAPYRWVLAAAAVLILATAVWQRPPGPEEPSTSPAPGTRSGGQVPTARLYAAGLAGAETSILDQMNAQVLPDPTRPGGALRLLGDVSRDSHAPWPRRNP